MYAFQGLYWVVSLIYEIVSKWSRVFPSFSHFGWPKPVFPRTVFTGNYHGKNRVPSKTLQPWSVGNNESTKIILCQLQM